MESLERATAILQGLSAERLAVALDFLEYLAWKEELEASEELARDAELAAAVRRAAEARRTGRTDEFVPWENRFGV